MSSFKTAPAPSAIRLFPAQSALRFDDGLLTPLFFFVWKEKGSIKVGRLILSSPKNNRPKAPPFAEPEVSLDGILDAALEIAEKRREVLVRFAQGIESQKYGGGVPCRPRGLWTP
jgi:hypothetical protein